MAAYSKGFTLVFHDPEKGTKQPYHMRPSPEEIQDEEKHLLTLIPLPGDHVVYKESHGLDIHTTTWRGTFGLKRRPSQIDPSPGITGTEAFFAFKKLFWDRYMELANSPKTRLAREVKIEYHDWDADKHYWCVPTRFLTPRGRDNRTFFRYDIEWQLYAPIKSKLQAPSVDAREVARQAKTTFERGLERFKDVGGWFDSAATAKATKFQNLIQRFVMKPMQDIVSGVNGFLSGATAFVNIPLRTVYRLIDGAASAVEQVGALTNEAVTTGINFLRNVRRAALRLVAAGEVFKDNMDVAAADYARFFTEEAQDTDSDAVLADIESGRNQQNKAYADAVTSRQYQGAIRAKVRENDTLQTLALKHIGDASAWRDIAMLNGYESSADLVSGADILIPIEGGGGITGVQGDLSNDRYSATSGLMDERLYGRDMRVVMDSKGKLDIVFDQGGDIATVGGKSNLIQAIMLKTHIEQGTLLENPEYGLRRLVGRRARPQDLDALRYGLQVTAESDPRIERANPIAEQDGNQVDVRFELFPVGGVGRRPVSAVVGRI